MSATAEETKQMEENDAVIGINKAPKSDHTQEN